MRLLCVLKSSPFFTSFDSDFLGGGTPENESDNIKQVLFYSFRICNASHVHKNYCSKS